MWFSLLSPQWVAWRCLAIRIIRRARWPVVKNGDVFKVTYQGSVESTVKMTIFDANEQPIFTERIISHGKFKRPYNFSQLPKGIIRSALTIKSTSMLKKFVTQKQRLGKSMTWMRKMNGTPILLN